MLQQLTDSRLVVIPVLCEKFRWHKDGIDILGPVSINTGRSFFAFPLNAENRKYFTQTTSTAMSVLLFVEPGNSLLTGGD